MVEISYYSDIISVHIKVLQDLGYSQAQEVVPCLLWQLKYLP